MKNMVKSVLPVFNAPNLLRAIILLGGLIVSIISIGLAPWLARFAEDASARIAGNIAPGWSFVQYTFLIGLYGMLAPFLLAVYQTWRLMGFINRQMAFSRESAKALKIIKICAAAVCIPYIAGVMPVIYFAAEIEDAPGLVLMGLSAVLVPAAVSAAAAVLQRVLFPQAAEERKER